MLISGGEYTKRTAGSSLSIDAIREGYPIKIFWHELEGFADNVYVSDYVLIAEPDQLPYP